MNPAPAAGSGPRLMAFGLGGLIVALAGAGSLAVAGEREAVVRMPPAPAAPPTTVDEQPRIVELGAGASTLLNGEPLPEGLPMWAVAPERIDVRTAPAGSGEMNFILPFTGATPVSVNGRRMPTGFPASGVNPDAVARVDVVGDHVRYTLKSEAEVRRARREAAAVPTEPSARQERDAAWSRLTPAQQARYRNPSGAEYRTLCASSDPADGGFCAGVIFAQFPRSGPDAGDICLPAELEQGDDGARRAALGILVDRTKAEIARASIRADDRPGDVARIALARAYPCQAAGRTGSFAISALTPAGQDGLDALRPFSDRREVAPPAAAEVARRAPDDVTGNGPASGPAPAPAEPRESDFLADQRAAREATRDAWPAESGLRLPNWPRPDRPARGSPFYNERRAADPQNAGVRRN